MDNNTDYITYFHDSVEVNTVGDFTDQDGLSIALSFNGREDELMQYSGDTQKTNRERVFDSYTARQRNENQSVSDAQLLLKLGTKLLIPKDRINRETLVAQGNTVERINDVNAFLANQLNRLLLDENYTQVIRTSKASIGNVKYQYPNVTVWVWCRALSKDGNINSEDDLQGTLVDVSPFVQMIDTSNSSNGGNFSLTLAPIICEPSPENGWSIKKGSIRTYASNGASYNYVANSNMHRIEDDLKRNQFYFHNIIGVNDIVFIRFETLKIEANDRLRQGTFTLSKSQLPGKIYDMIALVDTNVLSVNPQDNEVNISITGRDLIKTLIDDGCYFYPLEFSTEIFANRQTNDRLLRRVFGRLETLSAYTKRSISYSIQFVINQLANVGIAPDELFSAYGNERSQFFALDNQGNATREFMNGIWQIINLVIDPSIASRRVVDSSISTASGSLLNYINKVCQQPFCEFYSDTYGDQFYFIARQQPFDKRSFTQLIDGGNTSEVGAITIAGVPNGRSLAIDIEQEDVLSEQLGFFDGEIYSWYKINPQGVFFGQGSEMSLAYIPAIYFSEYADIWGSKPYDITYNYIPYNPVRGDKRELSQGYFQQQIFRDLKYIIDIHMYLPFTRTGTIVINGDRRIKKGTCVRYKASGEIFYVDAVSQRANIADNSVDRVTVLQVSRGMVEPYIKGRTEPGFTQQVSYFNIINTDIEDELIQTIRDGASFNRVIQNFAVNKPIFNFFLSRSQFKLNA